MSFSRVRTRRVVGTEAMDQPGGHVSLVYVHLRNQGGVRLRMSQPSSCRFVPEPTRVFNATKITKKKSCTIFFQEGVASMMGHRL